MKIHPVYGISAAEKGWVPTLSYSLRRNRVLTLLSRFKRGHLLEIGCGAGALLYDFSCLGFSVEAFEVSSMAIDIAYYINQNSHGVKIHKKIQPHWKNNFDYLVAFEVLEHIEDDANALKEWCSFLKKNGFLLLSVPAHTKRWNASDKWAGHFRRYNRKGLKSLIRSSGFELVYLENYGFPLTNIIEPIRAFNHAKELKQQFNSGKNNIRRAFTERSGIERKIETKLYPLQSSYLGTIIMQLFFVIQNIFSGTDLGSGLLVVCRKR